MKTYSLLIKGTRDAAREALYGHKLIGQYKSTTMDGECQRFEVVSDHPEIVNVLNTWFCENHALDRYTPAPSGSLMWWRDQ